MIPARLLAVVLWYAGFAPSPRIEDAVMASFTYYPQGRRLAPKRSARAVDAAGRMTGGVHSDDQKYA